MTRVAVLYSTDYRNTLNWIESRYGLKMYNHTSHLGEFADGTKFELVNSVMKAQSSLYSNYIKSPFYETLEDVIKTRLR
jgi:hypothetical protein